jgi:MFS family permease
MPWFVATLGLKRVVMIGMAAWICRYLCFSVPSFPLALLGLILHGFCYSFFYVGAYMYIDKRAPAELKASAQSLLAFLLLGVGWLLGAQYAGYMMKQHPPQVRNMAAVLGAESNDKRPLPPWNNPDTATSAWRYLDYSATLRSLVTGEAPQPVNDLAGELDDDGDGVLTMAEVEAVPDAGVTIGGHDYSRADLAAAFKAIANIEAEGEVAGDDIRLTRDQWLAAQSCNWRPIWLWPAAGASVILLIFALGFRDPVNAKTDNTEAGGDA